MLLVECEVGRAEECLEQAIAQGMNQEMIREIISHYRLPEHAGRWHPGILYDRLTRSGARFHPSDQGWFGDATGWLAARQITTSAARQQSREANFGELLDRLSGDELRRLAEELPERDRGYAQRVIAAGHARESPECRRLLLRQLMLKSGEPP